MLGRGWWSGAGKSRLRSGRHAAGWAQGRRVPGSGPVSFLTAAGAVATNAMA